MQREELAWGTAKVDEAIGFGAKAAAGEFAATAARGARDDKVYVTFVRMLELQVGNVNAVPAMLSRITVTLKVMAPPTAAPIAQWTWRLS